MPKAKCERLFLGEAKLRALRRTPTGSVPQPYRTRRKLPAAPTSTKYRSWMSSRGRGWPAADNHPILHDI